MVLNTSKQIFDDFFTTEKTPYPSATIASKMHWVTSTIVGSICVIFGITGNSLALLVWRRKSMLSSSGVYLTAQAIANIGVLTCFFLVDSLPMMEPNIKKMYAYGVFYSYVGYPIFFLSIVISIWVTVGVTVDRYILVCWIEKAKTMCSEKRAMSAVSMICFSCFVVNLPHFHTYQPVPHFERNPDDNAFKLTEFGDGESGKNYEFWVHCMFLVLLPWVTILILNVFIILRILRVTQRTKIGKSKEAQIKSIRMGKQLTTLLLTVTFTFLVLVALQCVTQCFFMLQPAMANLRIVDEAFSVAKLGLVLNSSINILLYCLSGRQFRRELVRIFCTLRSPAKHGGYSSNDPSTTDSPLGSSSGTIRY